MSSPTISTCRAWPSQSAALILLVFIGMGCRPAGPAAVIPSVVATSDDAPTAAPSIESVTTGKSVSPVAGARTRKLVIAMASDLRFVAPEIQQEFELEAPDIALEPVFGSSGKLFAQISNQAPFDVFLSADLQYPQQLAEQGLAKQESLFRYATGHIVLWVRNDSPLAVADQGAGILRHPQFKKLAIANPRLAPYGRAAEAALKTLGLYTELQQKLVLGENVAQAAQFAESGAADAAVIGLSFATAPEFAGRGKYWKFPPELYPRIEQGGVILEQSQNLEAAQTFCVFLQSTRAQLILKRYGFGLPEAP